MEPEHHNKIMIVVGVFVIIIAIAVGFVVIRGRLPSVSSPPFLKTSSGGYNMQQLIESATAKGTSTVVSAAELEKLKKSASVPLAKNGTGGTDPALLQKYIESASAH